MRRQAVGRLTRDMADSGYMLTSDKADSGWART
jgi:hypothetical protein